MSRLIDADVLLEHIKKLECHAENKKYEQGLNDCLQFYFPQIIDKQPTSYDVEKVVAELEHPSNYTIVAGHHYTTVDRAIDIVRKGGGNSED